MIAFLCNQLNNNRNNSQFSQYLPPYPIPGPLPYQFPLGGIPPGCGSGLQHGKQQPIQLIILFNNYIYINIFKIIIIEFFY